MHLFCKPVEAGEEISLKIKLLLVEGGLVFFLDEFVSVRLDEPVGQPGFQKLKKRVRQRGWIFDSKCLLIADILTAKLGPLGIEPFQCRFETGIRLKVILWKLDVLPVESYSLFEGGIPVIEPIEIRCTRSIAGAIQIHAGVFDVWTEAVETSTQRRTVEFFEGGVGFSEALDERLRAFIDEEFTAFFCGCFREPFTQLAERLTGQSAECRAYHTSKSATEETA